MSPPRYRPRRGRGFTNLLLFVGLVALAAVAWMDRRGHLPVRGGLIGAHAAPAATTVQYRRGDGEAVLLQREGDHWSLRQPYTAPLREERVARLLEVATLDFGGGYEAAEVNLSAAGLTTARRALRIDDRVFHFGALEPLSERRYVLHEGRVILSADRHLPLMDANLNALVELALPFAGAAALAIDGRALAAEPLAAWRSLRALGLRQGEGAPPASAHRVQLEGAAPARWRAWFDAGLWALRAEDGAVDYLLSAAQGQTLGLPEQR